MGYYHGAKNPADSSTVYRLKVSKLHCRRLGRLQLLVQQALKVKQTLEVGVANALLRPDCKLKMSLRSQTLLISPSATHLFRRRRSHVRYWNGTFRYFRSWQMFMSRVCFSEHKSPPRYSTKSSAKRIEGLVDVLIGEIASGFEGPMIEVASSRNQKRREKQTKV